MELTKLEVTLIEKTIQQANEEVVRELSDLQLACVGGGIAELVGV